MSSDRQGARVKSWTGVNEDMSVASQLQVLGRPIKMLLQLLYILCLIVGRVYNILNVFNPRSESMKIPDFWPALWN